MHSCRVFIEPINNDATTTDILPDELVVRVSVVGGKQIVVDSQPTVTCNVFNAATSLPINVAGFPSFLMVYDKLGCVAKVQGTAAASTIEFATLKMGLLRGFYKYEIVIGGQRVAEGSCVVR